ncbi:hypothetical protein KKC32_01485 [Patescibacteria group bacterium]|nr:hypothetical protein [Patescibacteria group bacterium]
MRLVLKLIAFVIAIIVGFILLFLLLVFLNYKFNIWPPSCSMLPPISQAKRVCEFSKLDKAKVGTQTNVRFEVSVPANTNLSDKIYLNIAGENSVQMEKTADYLYSASIPTVVGKNLTYSFSRNSESSRSEEKQLSVTRTKKNDVFDFVSSWSDSKQSAALPAKKIVMMMDTWTINYNFNLLEDTRHNIDSSMKRIKAMGGNQMDVFSFVEVLGNEDFFFLDEVKSPFKYMRDAAITEKDMKKLAETGKEYGLNVVLHFNTEADYTQFFNMWSLSSAGMGVGGADAHSRAATKLGITKPKTKEWIDMWFNGMEDVLLKWGASAEKAGIYGIDITPRYMIPNFAPEEKYANQRYRDLITKLRRVYHGKIFGSNFSYWGGISNEYIPEYAKDLDGVYIYFQYINVRENASAAEMKSAYSSSFNRLDAELNGLDKEFYLVMNQPSYKGSTSGKSNFEFNDYAENLARGYVADWNEQARAYEAFFQSLNGRKGWAGVATEGYWYDDLMDPDYADPLISMHPSIRNKPAEAVWKKWIIVK